MLNLRRFRDFCVVVLSCLFAFFGGEIGYRASQKIQVWQWTDFRSERAISAGVDALARYDADLGWVEKPNWNSPGQIQVSTSLDGVRNNISSSPPPPSSGAILAVGDSFTFGSDVADNETWPAFLEHLLRTPIINAAVEGYGLDQTVLRAETLLRSYKPQAVLLGIFEEDVLRATYSRFEKPKPYFNVVDGRLLRRNSPVPIDDLENNRQPLWRSLIGRSLILDSLLAFFDPLNWGGFGYERTREDPVELGRLLLRRMYQNTRQAGIPLAIVVQYSGETIGFDEDRPKYVGDLIIYARELGITVFDEFDSLRALVRERGKKSLENLFFVRRHGGDVEFGHRTRQGNRLVAGLIATNSGAFVIDNHSVTHNKKLPANVQ